MAQPQDRNKSAIDFVGHRAYAVIFVFSVKAHHNADNIAVLNSVLLFKLEIPAHNITAVIIKTHNTVDNILIRSTAIIKRQVVLFQRL